MSAYDEERLAQLIGMLPPAPDGWVQAAQELPVARRGLDQLVARAEADAAFRAAVLADLESALEAEGVEPQPQVVEALRRLLADG
jgi:beta-phosphoglucomutase-like phosphatase (HAD superfamily)